jgi:Tfp pilus assembly protein PilV
MSRLPCDNRGFTLIEVLIAVFITVVAVLGMLALMSPAWRTAAKADYLGRASGILYQQLMTQEAIMLNPCNAIPQNTTATVFASGQGTAQPGDAQFTVTTTITNIGTNAWSVNVRVAWPGHSGISETLVVTRQEGFRFPAGCVNQ